MMMMKMVLVVIRIVMMMIKMPTVYHQLQRYLPRCDVLLHPDLILFMRDFLLLSW